jgi:hypothetical protein
MRQVLFASNRISPVGISHVVCLEKQHAPVRQQQMIALGGDNPILVQIRAIANSRRDRHSKSKPRISSSTEPVLNAKDIFKAWEAGSGEGRDDTEAAVLRTLYYSNTSRAMQYLYASIPGPLLAPIGC